MATKLVTSGLTTRNDLINEIITFMTVDLPAPWTLVENRNPTNADVTEFFSQDSSRYTVMSIRPAAADVAEAWQFANHVATVSPAPTEMFIWFRNTTAGVQFSGLPEGSRGSPNFPPFNSQWDGALTHRPANDGRTARAMPRFEASTPPFTSLRMFGPEQESPQNPLIPNYVYFILETSPGRYSHAFVGEHKKMIPFFGGAGLWGSIRNSTDTVDNFNNATAWNDQGQAIGRGTIWCTCFNGQDNTYGGASSRNQNNISPEPVGVWKGGIGLDQNNNGDAASPDPLKIVGHTFFRDFMTGVSRAVLSGFQPLVTPFFMVGDWPNFGGNMDDNAQDWAPICYPEDFFLSDITNFEPGVQIDVGGIPIIPYPITSKLASAPRSTYGAYCYRVRT
jgi:hypothetical protein